MNTNHVGIFRVYKTGLGIVTVPMSYEDAEFYIVEAVKNGADASLYTIEKVLS